MKRTKPRTVEQQAKPIRELIKYARERDTLGKIASSKARLVQALMVLGRDRRDAERALENARRRVRRAANKAEERLEAYLRHEKPWHWTDPEQAIKDMRSRHFGCYEDAPLTDIELGLVQAGNVLWIVVVYPALADAIFSRLGRRNAGAATPSPDTTGATKKR